MRTEDEVRRRLDRAEMAALEPVSYQQVNRRYSEEHEREWRARVQRAETQRDMLRWVLGEIDPR